MNYVCESCDGVGKRIIGGEMQDCPNCDAYNAAFILLPDEMESFQDDDMGRTAACYWWNACLKEVKKLNGIK